MQFELNVTRKNIDQGACADANKCAIAQALIEATGIYDWCVGGHSFGSRTVWWGSHNGWSLVADFDSTADIKEMKNKIAPRTLKLEFFDKYYYHKFMSMVEEQQKRAQEFSETPVDNEALSVVVCPL